MGEATTPRTKRKLQVLNLPNILTFSRIIALIPMMWLGIMADQVAPSDAAFYYKTAAWVFMIIFLTDMLDGYLARKWNQITDVGILLDPLADKLMVLVALVILMELNRIPGWSVVIIIGREMAVTGLRSLASANEIVISAGHLGKVKTMFQAMALTALLHWDSLGSADMATHVYGYPLYWAAVAMTLISGFEYYAKYFIAYRSGASAAEMQAAMDEQD